MATIRPFRAFRPRPELAAEVASPPYDVLSSDEARVLAQGHPLSFLHVGKPEIDLDPSVDVHDAAVYRKGKENLQQLIDERILVEDPEAYIYVYSQTMGTHTQYGLVGCASVDEYLNDTIKKHELTRKDKEEDRSNHVRVTNAHTGPIFLTYRDDSEIDAIVHAVSRRTPEIDFTSSDGIRHAVWTISEKKYRDAVVRCFKETPNLYVADGHHRSAAAAIVGSEKRKQNQKHTGKEEYNFFLAVFFPAKQLKILEYNRVVKDLHGLTPEQFVQKISTNFTCEPSGAFVKPTKKGEFGLYLNGAWYRLTASGKLLADTDPVNALDVSILQRHLLDPVLGIKDPRTDKRIDFVGGIRGIAELERRVNSGEMAAAFSLFPASVDELMNIADAGKMMPPKSTWFEPKLRDGLFIHFLD